MARLKASKYIQTLAESGPPQSDYEAEQTEVDVFTMSALGNMSDHDIIQLAQTDQPKLLALVKKAETELSFMTVERQQVLVPTLATLKRERAELVKQINHQQSSDQIDQLDLKLAEIDIKYKTCQEALRDLTASEQHLAERRHFADQHLPDNAFARLLLSSK